MLIKFLYPCIPLSFSEVVNTITNVVSTLKGQAIDAGVGSSTEPSTAVTAAFMAGCFIVAIQLIKLSYDIMSDEQQGGFGGVRLWQILRPLLILFLIANSYWVFKLIDTSTKWVTDKITNSIGPEKSAQAHYEKMRNLYTELSKDRYGNDLFENNLNAYGLIEQQTRDWLSDYRKQKSTWSNVTEFFDGTRSRDIHNKFTELQNQYYVDNLLDNFDSMDKSSLDKMSLEIYNDLKQIRANGYQNSEENNKKIKELFKKLKTRKSQEEIDNISTVKDIVKLSWGELIAWIAGKIYDIMVFCIILFADIQMLILAIFFPWALVLSLFSTYKNAAWHYVTSYLTIGLTKVVAQSINWAISHTVTAMSDYTIGTMLKNLSDANEQFGVVKGVTLASALVYLTGFIALTKCGSIVNMLIPGASSASDTAAGGLAAASMVKDGAMKAAGGVTSGAGKAASVAVGGGPMAGAKAAKATKAFQANVTNALGKLSGGGTP